LRRYLTLGEYVWLAEQVTGVDAAVIAAYPNIRLADSALHAPQTSFGGVEKYSDLIDQAAVPACRLVWTHPLPDGNKRAGWISLAVFLDLNGVVFAAGQPDVDETEAIMVSVAAGATREVDLARWLRERTCRVTSAPAASASRDCATASPCGPVVRT
jgi:death on curing protein